MPAVRQGGAELLLELDGRLVRFCGPPARPASRHSGEKPLGRDSWPARAVGCAADDAVGNNASGALPLHKSDRARCNETMTREVIVASEIRVWTAIAIQRDGCSSEGRLGTT